MPFCSGEDFEKLLKRMDAMEMKVHRLKMNMEVNNEPLIDNSKKQPPSTVCIEATLNELLRLRLFRSVACKKTELHCKFRKGPRQYASGTRPICASRLLEMAL